MLIRAREKYIDNGKEVENYIQCVSNMVARLQICVGFRWSQVVDEGDVLRAYSLLYFMINIISFLGLC